MDSADIERDLNILVEAIKSGGETVTNGPSEGKVKLYNVYILSAFTNNPKLYSIFVVYIY